MMIPQRSYFIENALYVQDVFYSTLTAKEVFLYIIKKLDLSTCYFKAKDE